jgi:hypothetical protein
MENKPPKRILLLVTNCFAATNVIHSGLIKALAGIYEIYLLSDLIDEDGLGEINRHFGINMRNFEFKIPRETRLLKLFRKMQKALFFKHFHIKTQIIKEKSQPGFLKNIIHFTLDLILMLRLDHILLQILRRLIIRISQFPASELGNFHFHGVISSSPLDIRENMIVNALSRNVRSLAMIISWDNLTSKGLINANHDCVLVWNKFMETEYHKFYSGYGYDTNVSITGIARFDLYFEPNTKPTKASETAVIFGQKIILFATSAAKHFPEQTDIVRHLMEYAKTNPEIFILVRCHPGDDFELYKPFEDEKNVRIWFPRKMVRQEMPDLNTLISLSEMLHSCHVCVQIASTMRLDAAACGKPIISIAYDGRRKKVYHKSVRRFYDYSHQIPLNDLQIDNRVYSKNDLFNALNKVLATPSENLVQVQAIKEFIYFSEPKSVSTILNAVQTWLH